VKESTEDNIRDKIYVIRGLHVMLDRDLAELYHVKAIRLREQVKRNINRFPLNFMFQLTESESGFVVSQNAIPSKRHLGGSLPYAFTEQGVAMLSSVLRSETAVRISIQIMNAFVNMRRLIVSNAGMFQRLDKVEQKQLEHDKKFSQVFDAIENRDLKPDKGIFYDGQEFDAYELVARIIRSATRSIVLIDNYVDETVLTLFSKRRKNVNVTIYTKVTKELLLDVAKYNAQYPNITIQRFSKSHDRFMIVDDDVYHFGASLKDLGRKWFAFSRFDKEAVKILGIFKNN
jgi:hypothetical protein